MQPHIFRPTRTSDLRRRLLLAVPLGLLFLLPASYKLVQWYHVNPVLAGLSALALVLTILGLAWFGYGAWFATTTLTVDGEQLEYRAWGRSRTWPISEVAQLVRGTVLFLHVKVPSQEIEKLLFINHSGRCFFRLGSGWPYGPIAHAIGVHIQPMAPGVITAGDAAREYPGSYSWLAAHPGGVYLLGILSGIVVLGVIVAYILVTQPA